MFSIQCINNITLGSCVNINILGTYQVFLEHVTYWGWLFNGKEEVGIRWVCPILVWVIVTSSLLLRLRGEIRVSIFVWKVLYLFFNLFERGSFVMLH